MAIVLFAFIVRMLAVYVLGDPLGVYRVMRGGGLEWDWGYEQAAVAQSVAEGIGFADPFQQGTGATAWAAPFYPLLLGILIKLFGGITPGVAWVLCLIQSAVASIVCFWLWRLGRDLYSTRAGIVAALLWAVHPMAIYLPVALVWDSTFVALTLTWFLASMLEKGRTARPAQAARLGGLLGFTLLVNPAPLALIPVLAWYYLKPRFGRLSCQWGGLRQLSMVLGVALAVVSPWVIRNMVVLGTPQIRSNLGVEVFVGNNDGAFGPFNGRIHPAYEESEMQRYRELGEVAYSKEALERGIQWIEEHPKRFASLTLTRFQLFWLGPDPTKPLVLGTGFVQERDWMGWLKWLTHAVMGALAFLGMLTWKGRPGSRTVMRGALMLFPLVYYVTHVFERYRFPIEPLITLSAAVFLMRLIFGPDSKMARPDRRQV